MPSELRFKMLQKTLSVVFVIGLGMTASGLALGVTSYSSLQEQQSQQSTVSSRPSTPPFAKVKRLLLLPPPKLGSSVTRGFCRDYSQIGK